MEGNKILVVLTGGTICSRADENNENVSRGREANERIIGWFKTSHSPFAAAVDFDTVSLKKDILSENMTLTVWNELMEIIRLGISDGGYRGIIVLHGTDTLAYTSSLLGLITAGSPIPIIMVSSQLDLLKKETNGYANFKAAAELIMNGIAPNVYAVYRNMANERDPYDSMGETVVHYGVHLLQCGHYSHSFYSEDGVVLSDGKVAVKGRAFETDSLLINRLDKLSDGVLLIRSYVGLDYARFDLNGVKAIVVGTYHSGTVCVEGVISDEDYSSCSVLYLLKKAAEREIPVIMTPCDPSAYTYSSTGDALRKGAVGLYGMTLETAYIKTVVGVSLGKKGEELTGFLNQSINHEFIYK